MSLVSKNFKPPCELKTEDFFICLLSAKFLDEDYKAVMSNIELIRKTRGGAWPTTNLSLHQDLIDLSWHEKKIREKNSFAFAVFSKNKKTYLGCFYFYPPDWRKKAPHNSDVDVSFWVIQKAYDGGLYQKLYEVIKDWLQKDWPFKHPYWTNEELPTEKK